MEKLTRQLEDLIKRSGMDKKYLAILEKDCPEEMSDSYPFNRYEYIICHLMAQNAMSLEEYHDIRHDYLTRNRYLHLFAITAPRNFGETWAQQHVLDIAPDICNPSTRLDQDYSGQYDLWYAGIRIEVKASRAVDKTVKGSLISRALSSDSVSGFNMNFQQIKPSCCDVFIWIAVWKDKIRYWVLSSEEVKNNKYYSTGQHRGNSGEGQLWITESNIRDFDIFEVSRDNILSRIKEKGLGRDIPGFISFD